MTFATVVVVRVFTVMSRRNSLTEKPAFHCPVSETAANME
jgi:hypothetical protein